MNHMEFTVGGQDLSVLGQLYAALQQLDGDYPAEKHGYAHFQQLLREALPEALDMKSFTEALEARLSAELTYVSWLGFILNLDCFRFPACKKALEAPEFEALHREAQFRQLPQVTQASRTIEAFLRALPESCLEAAEGILDYFSYLETVGFKLAHYQGFQFANRFLPDVVPGYAPDPSLSAAYRRMLEQNLSFSVA